MNPLMLVGGVAVAGFALASTGSNTPTDPSDVPPPKEPPNIPQLFGNPHLLAHSATRGIFGTQSYQPDKGAANEAILNILRDLDRAPSSFLNLIRRSFELATHARLTEHAGGISYDVIKGGSSAPEAGSWSHSPSDLSPHKTFNHRFKWIKDGEGRLLEMYIVRRFHSQPLYGAVSHHSWQLAMSGYAWIDRQSLTHTGLNYRQRRAAQPSPEYDVSYGTIHTESDGGIRYTRSHSGSDVILSNRVLKSTMPQASYYLRFANAVDKAKAAPGIAALSYSMKRGLSLIHI